MNLLKKAKSNSFLEVSLDEIDEEKLLAFKELHKQCGSKEGKYSYIVTQLGIGKIVKIRCNKCRKTLDITSSENW